MIRFVGLKNTAKNTAKAEKNTNKIELNIENVLNYLKKYPNAPQKNIIENLQISRRTLERIIAFLKEEGYIKRIGNNRSGYWEILK